MHTRNPDRYQVVRRSQVETIDSTIATLPVGYAEVDGATLIMTKERLRVRPVEGEVKRLVEEGDLRKL